MAKVKIVQVKSNIKRPQKQKDTLTALGLRGINHSVVHDSSPAVMGMIRKVSHLIKVEEVK